MADDFMAASTAACGLPKLHPQPNCKYCDLQIRQFSRPSWKRMEVGTEKRWSMFEFYLRTIMNKRDMAWYISSGHLDWIGMRTRCPFISCFAFFNQKIPTQEKFTSRHNLLILWHDGILARDSSGWWLLGLIKKVSFDILPEHSDSREIHKSP